MKDKDIQNEKCRMPHISVIYSHFPHYRAPIFFALSESNAYNFSFFYDPRGVEKTILSGQAAKNHYPLMVRNWGHLMWQSGAIRQALTSRTDGFVFLGNPYIVSTWIATIFARLRRKPVFFWTHGWLRHDEGRIKEMLRRAFYSLADGLMVYSSRAKELGQAKGFDPSRIHVINNSLDYSAQRLAKELISANQEVVYAGLPDKPFFLCVARLVQSVQLNLAIEAMSYLPKNAVLIIVGEGPERATLQSQAQKLNVDVRFAGAIYNEVKLAPFFVNARAVVSPGKVGLLALHALAYGTPVITHGDLDRQMPEIEAIDDGVTGAFCRYADVIDLAGKMKIFLNCDEEFRATAKAVAIARIEDSYTPQAQAELIINALDTKLKGAC